MKRRNQFKERLQMTFQHHCVAAVRQRTASSFRKRILSIMFLLHVLIALVISIGSASSLVNAKDVQFQPKTVIHYGDLAYCSTQSRNSYVSSTSPSSKKTMIFCPSMCPGISPLSHQH